MSNTVYTFKQNTTPGVVPAANTLQVAEGALNTGDGRFYAKMANGTVVQISPQGGSNTHIQFNSSGSPGGDANLTWNSATSLMSLGAAGKISVGNSTVNVTANATTLFVGNSTVNVSVTANTFLLQGNTRRMVEGYGQFSGYWFSSGHAYRHAMIGDVADANDKAGPIILSYYPGTTNPAGIALGKSRGADPVSKGSVLSGDEIGEISFISEEANTTAFIQSAKISVFAEGTISNGAVPGRISFFTRSTGNTSQNPTERLRINEFGALGTNGGNFGSNGQFLRSAGSSDVPAWTTLASGELTMAGANTEVVFNDSARANTSSGMTFNKSSNVLTVSNTVMVGNSTVNAVVTSTSLRLANSTSNTVISIPSASDWSGNKFLHANGSWVTPSSNGSATPGGSNTQVQYNASGSFGGSSGLVFNSVSNTLTVSNTISSPNFAGDPVFLGNVTVSGNLAVNGTLLTLNVATLLVQDSMFKVAANNTANDLVDFGWYGMYGNSTVSQYSGIVRDASNTGVFTIFNTQAEPNTAVDMANSTFSLGTLLANFATAVFTANSTKVSITANALATDLSVLDGGTGVSVFANNGVLFGQNTSALAVTAAGTEGMVLQVNSIGAPVFGTLSGGFFS